MRHVDLNLKCSRVAWLYCSLIVAVRRGMLFGKWQVASGKWLAARSNLVGGIDTMLSKDKFTNLVVLFAVVVAGK